MSGAATYSWTLPPGPPLTEAQRALVVEALPLVPKVVIRLVSSSAIARRCVEDLGGVAREGLVWAAQKYDATRGTAWLSYAYGGALIRCLAWLRTMRLRQTHSLEFAVATDNSGGELTRLDVLADPAPLADELVHLHQVLEAVKRLPTHQRLAVSRLLDERDLESVAAEEGRSRECIRQWELAGLQTLRERLGAKPPPPREGASAGRLRSLLADGKPRTVKQMAAESGLSISFIRTHLEQLGAKPVGYGPGPKDGPGGAPVLWQLPT